VLSTSSSSSSATTIKEMESEVEYSQKSRNSVSRSSAQYLTVPVQDKFLYEPASVSLLQRYVVERMVMVFVFLLCNESESEIIENFIHFASY